MKSNSKLNYAIPGQVMLNDIQRAVDLKQSVLLLGEQAYYMFLLVSAEKSSYTLLNTANYYTYRPITLIDYISMCFQQASFTNDPLLLIESIDKICQNDPNAMSHLNRLLSVYSEGIKIIAFATSFEFAKYFDRVFIVPDLMMPDDLHLFNLQNTQATYRDMIKGSKSASTIHKAIGPEYRKMDWDKVGGLEDVKKTLLSAAHSLATAHKVTGVLLYGPPGTGKTLLARALATKLNYPLLARSIGDLLHSYIGESEKAIEKMFEDAKRLQPCIIFLDEIDALFGVGMGKKMSAQLSLKFDEMVSLGLSILVIGATNHVERIDKSLLRIGRFELDIHIGVPDREDCWSILSSLGVSEDIINAIVDRVVGMTGAEITQYVQTARQKLLESREPKLSINHFGPLS